MTYEQDQTMVAVNYSYVDGYMCLDRYCSLILFLRYLHSLIVREDMI